MEKLDPVSQEVVHRGSEVSNLVNSEGWQIVRDMLYRDMNDVASVFQLEKVGDSPDEQRKLIMELGARQIAIELITGWFKEIDGEVANYKENLELMKQEKAESDEPIIYRKDEDGA